MSPISLTTRISLLFAGAVAAVLLVAGFMFARAVDEHFMEADRHELEGKMELVRHLLARTATREAFDDLAQQLDDALVGHHGLAVVVADARNRIWFATSGADFPHALLNEAPADSPGFQQWKHEGRSFHGLKQQAQAGTGEFHTVALALDMTDHEAFMAKFRRMLALTMAMAALTMALLGWFATRRGLLPLRRITDLAATVSAERLGTRLPVAGVPAEIRPLASAFNAMLARLDESFQRLSGFSSDLAHELRTPISNLMTQTQVSLSRARDAGEYREILHSNLEEYERLARMIGDMLFLAKADNLLIVPRQESIQLAQLMAGLLEFHEAQADEKGVRLESAGSASVTGDRLMLQRAISNLLSNAIRHTPAGKNVRIMLSQNSQGASLSVENPGPRIPPEHLPFIFDRFYQADSSRRQNREEHSGLGLAITKSIIVAHGGKISVTSDEENTRFAIELPVAQNAAG